MVTVASPSTFSAPAARANLRVSRVEGLRNQAAVPPGAQTINSDAWTPVQDRRRLQQLTRGLSLPALLPQNIQAAEASLPEAERSHREFARSRQLAQQETNNQSPSLAAGLANRGLNTARSKLKGLASAKQEALKKAATEKMKKLALEKASRWGAKLGGHGFNAVDSFGEDAWVTYVITYLYDWCRAVVTILVPEPTGDTDQLTATASKGLHVFIPPYRLTEPGDLLYFIGEFILTMMIIVVVIAVLAAIYIIISDPAELLTMFMSTIL